jgi:uncharacterized protein YegP (UPF0339 family)
MVTATSNRRAKVKTRVELFKMPKGWRWRMTDARNGKIIGASTESYSRRIDAVRNLDRVGAVALDAYHAAYEEGDWQGTV